MTKYQGHKNWNHWNVSLWLNNEEPLYKMMCLYARKAKSRADAANGVRLELLDRGMAQTPDGAPYTKSSIRAAMVGL